MIDPVAIQLLLAGKSKGLHESYSFQGRSADGGSAFWLRHELLRRRGSREIQVDNVLVSFDRKTGATQCIHDQETVSLAAIRLMDLRIKWLEDGEEPMSWLPPEPSNVGAKPRQIVVAPTNGILDPRTYHETGRLTLYGGCGSGVANYEVEEKGQKQAFRLSWLRGMGADPDKVYTITADGASMEPRIREGDSIVIEMLPEGFTKLKDGKVYLVFYLDEWYVKRLFKNPETGGIRIYSDNPNKARFPDWNVSGEALNQLVIKARVLALAGAID